MLLLSVASELYPFVKTGGLADVVSALPHALAAENVTVSTLVPGYPAILAALPNARSVVTFPDFFGGDARVLRGKAGALDVFALDAPHLFAREGNPYTAPGGEDWKDNAQRFGALGRAAAELGRGAARDFIPDIVHAHDWQAGLAPAYLALAGGRRPATVFTVHNLAFQGKFDRALLGVLGIPYDAYDVAGVEYYGTIGYLKAGIRYADRITTVSPTYAAEILTEEGGMGLEGLLRGRVHDLRGILNGVDTDVWNPATDANIAATYDATRLEARATNTAALQEKLGLDADPGAFVLGVISRLSWQKGLDVLLEALPEAVERGVQVALLGAGEADLESGFRDAAKRSPGRVACAFGYDESLAHQIQAGAHALLVPSRFEPCGLTQLCALRYGAIPIVARAGGLADTVIDANEMALAAGVATGFMFWPVQKEPLTSAISRAMNAFRAPATWLQLRKNAMATDVSWRLPAQRYAQLYREATAARELSAT